MLGALKRSAVVLISCASRVRTFGRAVGRGGARVAWTCHKGGLAVFSTAQVQLSIICDFPSWLALCACAMTDTAEGRTWGAEESATDSAPAAPAAPATPMSAPSEPSSAGGSAAPSTEETSDLLQKIKALQDTQQALKEQKKKCAQEMKNAMKRKKRLQGKASQRPRGGFAYAQG